MTASILVKLFYRSEDLIVKALENLSQSLSPASQVPKKDNRKIHSYSQRKFVEQYQLHWYFRGIRFTNISTKSNDKFRTNVTSVGFTASFVIFYSRFNRYFKVSYLMKLHFFKLQCMELNDLLKTTKGFQPEMSHFIGD